MSTLILVLAVGAYALGLGRDETNQPVPRSGIRGVVEYGTCPPPSFRCMIKPTSATVVVRRDSDGAIARQFRPPPDGSFREPLQPGRYTIESGPRDEVPGRLDEQPIIVPRHRFIRVRIIFRSPEE